MDYYNFIFHYNYSEFKFIYGLFLQFKSFSRKIYVLVIFWYVIIINLQLLHID